MVNHASFNHFGINFSGLLNYLLQEYLSTVKLRQDIYLQIKLWN